MAVSVDTVYQKVLALANKEQRGYITPQEYNLFANQAQNEIFEQYFYDLNQFLRAPVGNKTASSDLRDIVEEKISMFRVVNQQSANINTNVYRLEAVRYRETATGNFYTAEEVSKKEYDTLHMSKLMSPPVNRPVFYRSSNHIYGSPDYVSNYDSTRIDYIRKPISPNWTYIVVDSKALWNPSASDMRNFELHSSEEKNLVTKILQYAGVSIKDFNLSQVAGQKEVSTIQQEKA